MTNNHKSEKLVLIDIDDGVGTLTLNRLTALNAFNLELAEEFIRGVDFLKEKAAVRAIVICGAGRVFSAGGDVREMLSNVESGDRAAYFRAPLAAFHRMSLAVRCATKPVLASVHGAVAGVAFNLMLACDLRIAAEGTRFTQAFVRLGLSPDGGGTYLLPRLVGHARATELTMLPTEISAETALAWGLINWVVPADALEAETKTIAAKLAQGPSVALGRLKDLMNRAENDALAEHMEKERLAQVENAATEDFEEGLRAFMEKRKPNFRGR